MRRPSGIEAEFDGLSLGDKRLERRALKIVARVTSAPSESFPELLPNSAELEGAYRFFQNEGISCEELLEPHVQASLARARKQRVVRILHDTTALSFGGEREGLGTLGGGGCGFWAQVALAVADGEERAPLGVVGLETKVYPTLEEKAERHRKASRKYHREKLRSFPRPATVWKCPEKWSAIPLRLCGKLPGVRAIHVMDQEADNSELLSLMKKHRMHFVIRGSSGRLVTSPDEKPLHLRDRLAEGEVVLRRRVRLEARPKSDLSHAARKERDARLSVRAARVTLAPANGERLPLNVVEVFERTPPEGDEPVNWVLLTTEPIETPEQVAAVVDHYRARWRIEEYFKALKTGCSIEKRQLTDYDALKRALALFIPVAWHLLALRAVAHQERPAHAASVLTALQLTVLRALASHRKVDLPQTPSARDALLALAAVGGHLKRNGDPGWLTLGRGYDKLQAAESVWRLATAQSVSSDQS